MSRFARSLSLLLLLVLAAPAALAQGTGEGQEAHIELILDASGSMFNKLEDGRYRIVAAKEVLAELVAALPAGTGLNVGYRAYGSEFQATAPGSCEDSRLLVPIEGVDRQLLLDTVKGTQARGATPIAYSLERALDDLGGRAGKRIVVLITDGEEGCGGDVRAAAEALRAAGIDLRIIGFDLDPLGRAAFEGVGAFENATSAAELLAALTRAVEEAAAPAAPLTYPVRVTLLREGQPASDGPAVAFIPALGTDADAEPFAEAQGEFHTELQAGAYSARVADAHSAEPLVVSGLVVTPEGPNRFTFELAPALAVTLTPATDTPNAGATLSVAWEGAPPADSGYIALTPAGEDITLMLAHAPGESGEAALRLPSEPGDYELRYLLDQPSGATDLLGIAQLTLQPVSVTLMAPEEAVAGSAVEVAWEGPDNEYDFLTIVLTEAPAGTWNYFAYTEEGNPALVRTPVTPGDYEVRYLDGASHSTLAAVPILVTEAAAAFTAPAEAAAGSVIELDVTAATGHHYDYITIVEPGTPAGVWGSNYTYIDGTGLYELVTAELEGDYLLRYQTEEDGRVLAERPITLTPTSASLVAPAGAGVGEYFDVTWEGPGHQGDFVTIVPAGAPEGEWGWSLDVSGGNPLTLYAGDEPGEFEVRYVTGQRYLTLARVPISVR